MSLQWHKLVLLIDPEVPRCSIVVCKKCDGRYIKDQGDDQENCRHCQGYRADLRIAAFGIYEGELDFS